jgi:hypothetical protein
LYRILVHVITDLFLVILMKKSTTSIIAVMLVASLTYPSAFAEANIGDKLSFASSLEETLGHFWAIEQNLDDNNAELALVHATHPIAELYDSMKPQLKAINPEFDAKIHKTLLDLGSKTGSTVTRQDAQKAIDDAKQIIADARNLVVGDKISNDVAFKVKLMQVLLETSIAEYGEAVSDGVLGEMAEFQDGCAVVWRSQQIFESIRPDRESHIAEESDEFYADLWTAYDKRKTPK